MVAAVTEKGERRAAKARAKEIAKGDAVAGAVKQSVDDVMWAVMGGVVAATASAASSGDGGAAGGGGAGAQ